MALLDVEAAYQLARERHEQVTAETDRQADREADQDGEGPARPVSGPP